MKKIIYVPLTTMNLSWLMYVIGTIEFINVFIFFIGMLVNHSLLLHGVQSMMSENQKKSYFLILKFFILIGVFIFAMITMPQYLLILTISYIFQLIILVLSIKSNRLKN